MRAVHSSGPHAVFTERLQCRTMDPLSVPLLTPVAWFAVLYFGRMLPYLDPNPRSGV